jgi:hypothetical protein
MSNEYVFIDGRGKSVTLSNLDNFLDYLVGKGGDKADIEEAHRTVPWLYRATDIRKNAVAGVPFKIYRGDEEVDSSASYQNVVGFMPNPFRLLREIEGSLTLTGRSYLWNSRNRVKTLDLRYLVPTSVKPVITETSGLTGWERNTGSGWRPVELEDIVYLWGDDTFVELGPPNVAPGIAALIAAGLLMSVDEFATKFAERGMVKASLIKVPKGTAKGERNRLKRWFKNRLFGTSNSGAVETVEADTVEVHTIGEGLSELAEVELTTEKQHDIATALGVPVTKLFSGDASGLGGGGVVDRDEMNLYKETVVPECLFIASELNRQVFEPMGYSIRFHWETMDIFQEDETRRASAVKTYVGTGYKVSVASEILGVELPEGMEYADLDEPGEPEPEPAPDTGDSDELDGDNDFDERMAKADMRRWRSIALRRLKASESPVYNFESRHIDPATHAQIIGALQDATTAQEVKAAFAARFQGIPFYP